MATDVRKRAISYLVEQKSLPHGLVYHMSIRPTDEDLMELVVHTAHPKNVLEVGAFVGVSAAVIVNAMARQSATGKLTVVDANFPINTAYRPFYDIVGDRALYYARELVDQFKGTIDVQFIEGYFSCTPVKAKEALAEYLQGPCATHHQVVTQEVAKNGPYDLIFLDAEHQYEAVLSDLTASSAMLQPSGLIVCHDCANVWSSKVVAGVDDFIRQQPGWEFSITGNLGFVRRVGTAPWLTTKWPLS